MMHGTLQRAQNVSLTHFLSHTLINYTPSQYDIHTGWDEGVMEMSLGEKAILHITSDYGYGSQGAGGVIPPDADLDFQVELLKIGDAEAVIPKDDKACCVAL